MSIIFITILILFLIKLFRDSLFYVWLWQIKEYRIDRMKAYLRDEKSIVYRNISYYFLALWIMTCFMHQVVFIFLTLLFFIFTFSQIIIEIKNRTLKRPRFTLKVILVFFLEVIFYFSFFALYWIPVFTGMTKLDIVNMGMTENLILFLLFSYLITPFLITIIILLINPFFNFQKRRIIKKAKVKMKTLKKVKVIGITGSYGKTSTKEFLYAILSQKYKVVKTEGNNNTNIGVAYTVLNKVNDEFDYFICEMGAYKIGDIVEICDIVKPEIGILTGINEQHLELFGSIENTIKAKFELIEALPENGLAILNGDNKYIESKIKNRSDGFNSTVKFFRAKALAPSIKVYQNYVEFDFQTTLKESSDCHSEFISESIDDSNLVSFNLSNQKSEDIEKLCDDSRKILNQVQDDKYDNLVKFRLNLLGKHYIENIISAIMVAEHLGMKLDEIARAVEKIKPTEYMMRKLDGPNNSIFIDDSYSANPDGVIAALDYLDEAYKDYKKIIVFPGIIELGKESDKIHQKLFGKIADVCDNAYIMNDDLKNTPHLLCRFTPLKRGIKKDEILRENNKNENDDCEFIFEKDFDKVAGIVEKDLDKNTVVLFESRGAGVVMRKLEK